MKQRKTDRVVTLMKQGGEAYVFRYDSESGPEFLKTLGRFAADKELSFTWHDAASLARSHHRERRSER